MKVTAVIWSLVMTLVISTVVQAQNPQLDTYLQGPWEIGGKIEGETVKGRMTVAPAVDGYSLFYRWTMNYAGEVHHGSAMAGIDSASGKMVEHSFSQGTHWTNTYDKVLTDSVTDTTGTQVGIVDGEPYKAHISVKRTSEDRFVYKVEGDQGDVIDLVFERIKPDAEGENAFKAYGELAAGGTWVAEVDGQRFEDTYEWILDKKFLRLTSKASGDFSEGVTVFGVDPKTGKFTSWGFNADGMVSRGTSKQVRDGVWVGPWGGIGPMGSVSSRAKVTRVDDNTVRYEILEQDIDGDVPAFTKVSIWKRKR
jgi:hypothetical protein